MKLLLIPNKFKGSLTSDEFSNAFISGVEKSGVSFSYSCIKLSDVGDNFLNVVAYYKPCISMQVISTNPLGKRIQSYYLYSQQNNAAYIELANASGKQLLMKEDRNPMLTTTYGTGIQIKDAIEKGIEHIYMGLGGSATVDGGIGIANALGYVFLNEEREELDAIGASLQLIDSIDDAAVSSNVRQVNFYAVNDISNPLFGENGTSYLYAGEKGASDVIIEDLDRGLINLDKIVSKQYSVQNGKLPGAGAGGGTGFGLKSFFNADMLSGEDFILELSRVKDVLALGDVDYIITGECKIDGQSLCGKLLQGIISLGKKYNTPVIVICGKSEISKDELERQGIFDVVEFHDEFRGSEYNMRHAAQLLIARTADYFAKK
ncbi:glycerate kinase family protein [Maribacter ulvicola]|uniref:Glycerate kinase n=1 Tax=Maribacter ulvicola TaxID=228959 RepID=A0A1N6NRK5_9FLAO|nr:glycerate kinase [Maribacter ulvicola]SIP94647.1 glycerate kinase [Maribacter ulvicola]